MPTNAEEIESARKTAGSNEAAQLQNRRKLEAIVEKDINDAVVVPSLRGKISNWLDEKSEKNMAKWTKGNDTTYMNEQAAELKHLIKTGKVQDFGDAFCLLIEMMSAHYASGKTTTDIFKKVASFFPGPFLERVARDGCQNVYQQIKGTTPEVGAEANVKLVANEDGQLKLEGVSHENRENIESTLNSGIDLESADDSYQVDAEGNIKLGTGEGINALSLEGKALIDKVGLMESINVDVAQNISLKEAGGKFVFEGVENNEAARGSIQEWLDENFNKVENESGQLLDPSDSDMTMQVNEDGEIVIAQKVSDPSNPVESRELNAFETQRFKDTLSETDNEPDGIKIERDDTLKESVTPEGPRM